jgi:hypothetical protein
MLFFAGVSFCNAAAAAAATVELLRTADAVPEHCPRVLLNRERVGEGMGSMGLLGSLLGLGGGGGFTFEREQGAYRDVLHLGDTDEGVRELCKLLGWEQELDALIEAAPEPSTSGSAAGSSDSSAAAEGAGSVADAAVAAVSSSCGCSESTAGKAESSTCNSQQQQSGSGVGGAEDSTSSSTA